VVSEAQTVAGALHDFWHLARTFSVEEGPVGREMVLAFPCWDPEAKLFDKVMEHIKACGSMCEYLSDSLMVIGRHPASAPAADEAQSAPLPMIVYRSYRQAGPGDFSQENFGEEDPFANEETVFVNGKLWSTSAFRDEPGAKAEVAVSTVPSDEEVVASTAAWVSGLASEIGIRAPLDVGASPATGVGFPICSSTIGEEIYEHFWAAVLELSRTTEQSRPSIVMITPAFTYHNNNDGYLNANVFELLASSLNTALSPAQLNLGQEIQLVFFHPQNTCTHEDEVRGVSFARVSPFPMVGVLRTSQVKKARQGMPSGGAQAQALVEVHERICGPRGGLIPF